MYPFSPQVSSLLPSLTSCLSQRSWTLDTEYSYGSSPALTLGHGLLLGSLLIWTCDLFVLLAWWRHMGCLVNTQVVPQIPPDGEKRLPPVGSEKWLNSQNPTILYPVLTCSIEKGSLVPFGLLDGQAVWVSGKSKVGREPGGQPHATNLLREQEVKSVLFSLSSLVSCRVKSRALHEMIFKGLPEQIIITSEV